MNIAVLVHLYVIYIQHILQFYATLRVIIDKFGVGIGEILLYPPHRIIHLVGRLSRPAFIDASI